jgi:hypothetical protein
MSKKISYLSAVLVICTSELFKGCGNRNKSPKPNSGSGGTTKISGEHENNCENLIQDSLSPAPPDQSPAVAVPSAVKRGQNFDDSLKIDHSVHYTHKFNVRLETMRFMVPLVDTARADDKLRDFHALATHWKDSKVQGQAMDTTAFSTVLTNDLKDLVLFKDLESEKVTAPGAQGKWDVLMIHTTCEYDREWKKVCKLLCARLLDLFFKCVHFFLYFRGFFLIFS